MTSPYPRLLAPLLVGAHTLRNRVVMGSMHTRLETLDQPLERLVAFYVARARGGAALLVTAGHSPNREGRLEADAQVLDSPDQVPFHAALTRAVHAQGAKMLLQILHAGRYAKHDDLVAPSAIRSAINRRTPRALADDEVARTIEDFVRTAELARDAGYDGVEIMGSEGYLLTQFAARRSNARTDRWGGSLENRCRISTEIVARIRARLGSGFLLSFRISAIDLLEDGLDGGEIAWFARAIEQSGADLLVTGIGWHESPVPTIANPVPRAAWAVAAARLKAAVRIPVVATNRINTPEVAESLLAAGSADLVALARPLLADPDFVIKAADGRAAQIAPCIACNQSCLDRIFSESTASCLVNPLAGHEIEYAAGRARARRRVAVVGAGPAGLACAIHAADRGHEVVLFEADAAIGGQLRLAARIPGKAEFAGLLTWFERELARTSVHLRLQQAATVEALAAGGFDRIVVATGSRPRQPQLEGLDHPSVAGYRDVILGTREVGPRVAIIGTGGIGHDVAELLAHAEMRSASDAGSRGSMLEDATGFFEEWGVDPAVTVGGGLRRARPPRSARRITMFQRGTTRPGARLGVSTGWILRARLKSRGVEAVANVRYERIDDAGLHYSVGGVPQVAAVDAVVVCAGQEPDDRLTSGLRASGQAFDVIGGARLASELDAARAIHEGTRLAWAF